MIAAKAIVSARDRRRRRFGAGTGPVGMPVGPIDVGAEIGGYGVDEPDCGPVPASVS